MITEERLEQLRAKEARVRKTYRQLLIVIPATIVATSIFSVLQFYGLETITADGVVLGEQQFWTLKKGTRCRVLFQTDIGPAELTLPQECLGKYKAGQAVAMSLRIARITRSILIMKLEDKPE